MGHFASLAGNRDFTLLWTGGVMREVGTAMAAFALPLIAFTVSGSALAAGWVTAMEMVGFVLLVLPAGVVVDRFDRRRLMVLAATVGALAYASLVAAALAGSLGLVHLAAVAFVTGCCEAFSRPSEMASVRRVVAREDLPAAMSQNSARASIAELGGGPLSGLVLGLGRAFPFIATVLGYVGALVCALSIRSSLAAPVREGGDVSARHDLVHGLRFVVRSPFRRAFFVFAAASNLGTAAIYLLVAVRMLDAGWSPLVIGLTETASGLAALGASAVAPSIVDRVGTGWIAILAAFVSAVAVVPLIWTVHPIAVAVLLSVATATQPVMIAGVAAYLLTTTPDEMQGRVSTATNFVTHATIPLGPLAGGALAGAFGFEVATGAVCGFLLLCAFYVLSRRVVREVGTPTTWPEEPEPVPEVVLRGRHRSPVTRRR